MPAIDARAQAVGIMVIGLGALLAIIAAIPWASKGDIDGLRKEEWQIQQRGKENANRLEGDIEKLESDRISLHERIAKLEVECAK